MTNLHGARPEAQETHGRASTWRAWRILSTLGILAVGLALALGAVALVIRWEYPAPDPPSTPGATIVLIVTDTRTARPLRGAEVVIEIETGDFNAKPEHVGFTDATGQVRLVCGFPKPALKGRGPHERETLTTVAGGRFGSTAFVVRAPHYKEGRLFWSDVYAALLDHNSSQPAQFSIALPPG